MQGHTVLLLYPDYLAADYGTETFRGWSEQDDVGRAIEEVQRAACEANNLSLMDGCAADFYPLLVMRGWQNAERIGADHGADREGA
jgi:hypothetical protein